MKTLNKNTFLLIGILFSSNALADEFDKYTDAIDNYNKYTYQQSEKIISDFIKMKSNDIQKDYYLGMLYFLQSYKKMSLLKKELNKEIDSPEILKNKKVQYYFNKTKEHYDNVEKMSPGYKYIYCKYSELYHYSLNKKGLIEITKITGIAKPTKEISQCKEQLMSIANSLRWHKGTLDYSKAIYETAVEYWDTYPKNILSALGGIEEKQKNLKKSEYWWQRCLKEAQDYRLIEDCQNKGRYVSRN